MLYIEWDFWFRKRKKTHTHTPQQQQQKKNGEKQSGKKQIELWFQKDVATKMMAFVL